MNLASWLTFLNQNKDAFLAIQSVGTVLAVSIGGAWAFLAFRRRRLSFPRANIRHSIRVWQLSPEYWHLHVTVNIQNEGEVLLRIDKGCAWVQLIDPCPEEVLTAINAGNDPVPTNETEVLWPRIGAKRDFNLVPAHEIEPGESDEVHADMFLETPVNRVLIYTHFANSSKGLGPKFWQRKQIGWNYSTFFDIPPKDVD